MIAATDLLYDYDAWRALHGVSIAVPAGSITALVGANGAGKTTLLRCLAGLLRPLAGSVRIADVDVSTAPRRAHRLLGYLSDFFGLYEDLSVIESLRFAARAQGVALESIEASVALAAERTNLSEHMQSPVAALSRGLRQRLGIAQALVHQPKVLLLDEPASGLDPEARLALSQLLRNLRAEGMTLLVSSHILAELEDYCTHMVVMQRGRILEEVSLDARATQVQQVYVELSEPFPLALALSRACAGVLAADEYEAGLLVTLAGAAHERAQLLKALIEGGAPVCGLREHREALQQRYFKAVRGPTSG